MLNYYNNMKKIINSICILILSKKNEILLLRQKNKLEKEEFGLIWEIQNDSEDFNITIRKTLKKKLNINSKISNKDISLEDFGKFKLYKFKSYNNLEIEVETNKTIFVIETDISKEEFEKKIKKEIIFFKVDNLPNLISEHKKFIKDYFFECMDYTVKEIQKISIAVDIVILTIKDGVLKFLLTRRSKEPYKNLYSLPGGFISEKLSIENSAKDILKRDTSISDIYLEQLYTFGDISRDKRGRTISIAYYALLDYSKINLIYSKKYDEINWFSISQIKKLKFAFDHKKIIDLTIERIKNKIEYTNLAFQLLPEKFTLAELQDVYETILEQSLDKRNFRKKINELDMLIELEEFKKQGRMRPARYYKFKDRTKENILKVKKWI